MPRLRTFKGPENLDTDYKTFLFLFLGGADFGPTGALRGGDALAAGGGDGPLLAGGDLLAGKIDFAEGGESRTYAVEFIFQAGTFLLELIDDGVYQRFSHCVILPPNEVRGRVNGGVSGRSSPGGRVVAGAAPKGAIGSGVLRYR